MSKRKTTPAPVEVDPWEEGTRLLRRWYFEEVRSLAREALRENPKDEEARDEWLHETIDGHEYIIYTGKTLGVLLCSDNADAEEEETGEKSTDDARRAYFAMRADVREQLDAERSNMRDEWLDGWCSFFDPKHRRTASNENGVQAAGSQAASAARAEDPGESLADFLALGETECPYGTDD